MKLSVIVPSIRPGGLLKLYESIDIDDFEMIVVGPNPPDWYSDKLRYVHSMRSPNACQQLALLVATGDYITFAADDGVFMPNRLSQLINLYSILHLNYKTILVGKYIEGDNPNTAMFEEDYYKFKYHKTYDLKGVPQNDLIFNCGIISRKFIMELGGWDAENFDCTTMAHADLGIRASKAGSNMTLMDKVVFKCSHEPGKTGTHAPVHNAMKRDIVNFRKLYSTPNKRIEIDVYNYLKSEVKWKARFK